MSRICYINQPRGLGDIIICEPIMRWYRKLGYEITYWVVDEYLWIKDYIKDVNFISVNENYIVDTEPIYEYDKVYLPLFFKRVSEISEWNITGWLYDKYRVARLDPMMWKSFTFDRNYEKEEALFNYLGLEGKDYILANGNSSSTRGELSVNTDNKELPIIQMNFIEGYTMLDWCKVIERSKEFHTTITSVQFPAMKLNHSFIKLYNKIHYPALQTLCADFNLKYE